MEQSYVIYYRDEYDIIRLTHFCYNLQDMKEQKKQIESDGFVVDHVVKHKPVALFPR